MFARKLARWIYRTILRTDARNSLQLMLMLHGHDKPPETITQWNEKSVMVLAPHMDDEVIGCGGAILQHAANGAKITTVFLTDGRWGSKELLTKKLDQHTQEAIQKELIVRRKEEAQQAAVLLGVHRCVFIDAEDAHLTPNSHTVGPLTSLIDEIAPELIYLPFLMDGHEDHWQTNRILYASLTRISPERRNFMLRGYEVWTPLIANRIADITHHMTRKLSALALYQSQLKDVDYCTAIDGLNRYRAMFLGVPCVYAEAYFEATVAEYQNLYARATGA